MAQTHKRTILKQIKNNDYIYRMSDKVLPQVFGRVGSKTRLKKILYKLFPKDFDCFVEPYVGGGSIVMGYPFKPSQKIVINDIDKNLIWGYRFIKTNPSIANTQQYNTKDMQTLEAMKNKKKGTKMDKLVGYIINTFNTFGSKAMGKVFKSTNPMVHIKRIPEHAAKLKNIIILNEPALKVISKYNKAGTFLYLDPPYEGSTKGMYESHQMDYKKLAAALRGFKGKFLLSVNASPSIKSIFSGFTRMVVRDGGMAKGGNAATGENLGQRIRTEYIIKNY